MHALWDAMRESGGMLILRPLLPSLATLMSCQIRKIWQWPKLRPNYKKTRRTYAPAADPENYAGNNEVGREI